MNPMSKRRAAVLVAVAILLTACVAWCTAQLPPTLP